MGCIRGETGWSCKPYGRGSVRGLGSFATYANKIVAGQSKKGKDTKQKVGKASGEVASFTVGGREPRHGVVGLILGLDRRIYVIPGTVRKKVTQGVRRHVLRFSSEPIYLGPLQDNVPRIHLDFDWKKIN